ncbi:hypothetical protein [Faecalimonas sp.]
MQEQYRHEIDNIHAPKDLIAKTRRKMQLETQSMKKKRKKPMWISMAVAACACITVLGGYIYIGKMRNNIDVQIVSFREMSEWNTGLSLGVKQDIEKEKKQKIEWEELDEKDEILKEILKVKPSKVRGKNIYICKEKGMDKYYAVYKDKGKYVYVYGENISEKKFFAFLKKSCNLF